MKQWFLRYTPREQLALLLMGAAIVLWLLFTLALRPLDSARSNLQQTNRATVEQLQRVDALASAILAQREAGGTPGRSRNLTAVLNSGADAAGLRIARLQPNSRGAVQLRFEAVPFAALLRWVHGLESEEGLLLEEVSISQTATAGFVNASLRVSQPL